MATTGFPGGANGASVKNSSKVNNKSFGATFSPGFTVNVNATGKNNGGGAAGGARSGGGRGGVHPESLLPAPEFTSPALVRNYCNSLRALATGLSFELSMAAEIMQGVLGQVPDPSGRPFGSKMRARRVARKLAKSADSFKAAAVNAASTYSVFQQEFEEEINRVRHRARPRKAVQMNWTEQ
ncbi:plasmid transfer protein TraA [Streptomyces acidiscabies]|uniref:Plasmid transfer protein TraA n=1 Tax=Streptomyces acidiscabies TaxID=42234 RepID=A0ABU4M8X3_9ACTN|nr:plasmid transfer protein TraA [Streptomyces acidiscabies]MBP5938553.1 sporulation protein SsgA [Streptomyces sp. LBUM 1476]MDX3024538.1 plasmid transfer protein TraA [Streptomyces acidiscabies]